MANLTATTEAAGHAEHAEPTALGFDPAAWIALAMLVVFALMLWKKVPAAIGKALDGKIAQIRDQLAEATALREEAEALKAEYEAKAADADAEASAMVERAKAESKALLAKAKTDAEALVERRAKMAEDKIAAEERTAIEQLRSVAANAAAKAAAKLIAERHDAASDARVVDQAIKEIAGR